MGPALRNSVGCAECAFLADCGGTPGTASFLGCFSECFFNCNPQSCDLTCPYNEHLFPTRFMEIEGTFKFSEPPLTVPATQLPQYVPKIDNGSGRLKPLNISVATIPARALISKSGSDISCRFQSPGQVRQHFCLSSRTSYVISCITDDSEVEMFWEGLKYGGLAEGWARLKPTAVIVPNFSFFVDVPRFHTMYNRKRICLAARILSDAGCRVIVPMSALTPHDWNFWYELLTDNPDMQYIAKELQTGLKGPKAAKKAIHSLSELQNSLGRSIHPVVLGGSRYSGELNRLFDKHTIVDSRPFMLMAHRIRAVHAKDGSYLEVPSPTVQGDPTDELLLHNIKARRDKVAWIKSHS